MCQKIIDQIVFFNNWVYNVMNNFYDKFVYSVRIVFGGFCEHFGCFEFVKLGWLEMSGNLFHYFVCITGLIRDILDRFI